MLAFTAHQLVTPTETVEHPLLLVDQGTIADVVARSASSLPSGVRVLDLGHCTLAPGYIDLHIHGSAGFDVMDESADSLPSIERFLAGRGVTTYFPTTVTASMDQTLRALERLATAIEDRASAGPGVQGRAQPIGIHLEGPFISHARRGVHPPEHLLVPKLEVFESLWQAARGHIRVITIAPELEGAAEVIAEASRREVCVSLGHSDADTQAAERGVAAGACHATHTFNAMRPLDHRQPGILGAALTDCRLSADIIADGIHVDPSIIKLFAQAKGLEQTVLITDATAATGMPDGPYRLGSLAVEVKDGKVTANGKLAGSALTMDLAVRNLARYAGWSLPQAIAAASRNPARTARLTKKGSLVPGADADFVALSPTGDVLRTFIAGQECSA